MCDVVEGFSVEGVGFRGSAYHMEEGQRVLIVSFEEEDEIMLDDNFYNENAELHCKHPNTDWHLMEVPKGQALRCPIGTKLKIVLPTSFIPK